MTIAEKLLASLDQQQISVKLEGEHLRLKPPPPPQLLAEVRNHKSELVNLLAASSPGPPRFPDTGWCPICKGVRVADPPGHCRYCWRSRGRNVSLWQTCPVLN